MKPGALLGSCQPTPISLGPPRGQLQGTGQGHVSLDGLTGLLLWAAEQSSPPKVSAP